MFEKLDFWVSWPKRQRNTLLFLLVLIACSAVLLISAYYSGGSFIIRWEEHNSTKPVRVLFDQFYSGLYQFSIYADQYLITQSLLPGKIYLNPAYSYLFLILFTTVLLFLYALATTLSRFYFILASVFFAITLLMYRFENLLLFDLFGKEVYAGVLLLYFIVAYFLHAIQSQFSLTIRFGIFLIISILLAIFFHLFSQADQPFMLLSTYFIIAPLTLSVLFILLLGFEVTRGFIYVASQSGGTQGMGGFVHFAIITLIYLGVLVLIFLYKHQYIEWKVVFLDSVWILLAASILGFWGFRMKEESYAHIFSFQPLGAYVFMTLAFTCFSSFAYFFITANDPYVEVLTDAILISQISYSLLFLVYVIANFSPAMAEGHQVHKVLYKPKFMPYFSAKLAAFIGVVALFFVIKMAPYYQAYAGYYISIAQLFKSQENHLIAHEYFNLANIYGSQTHMGNYALAEIAETEGNNYLRDKFLARAINTNPTEYAFAKFARGYHQANKPFDEVFALKNGVNLLPDSGPLQNNLGLAFANLNTIDTSLYHLHKAFSKNNSRQAAKINIPAAMAIKKRELNWDSLVAQTSDEKNISVLNNIAVLHSKNNRHFQLSDTLNFNLTVSIDQLVFNYTLLFDHPDLADSASWESFKRYFGQTQQINFEENLEYAFAHAFIKTGKSIAALRILRGLRQHDQYGYSQYDLLIAQALLKFGAADMALPYFKRSIPFYGPEFTLQYVIALMESKKYEQAEIILTRFKNEDGNAPLIVDDLLAVLEMDSLKKVVDKDDMTKYNFLHYKGDLLSDTQFEGLIISMEDEGYKYAAQVELIKKLLKAKNYEAIKVIVSELKPDAINSHHIKIEYIKALIRYYWNSGQFENLELLTSDFGQYKSELGAYFLLCDVASARDNDQHLNRLYWELGSFNAFCEEGIISASNYFMEQGESLRAYNILLEAIEWNQLSMPLNKAYIKTAIEMGLTTFVDDVLLKLEEQLPEEKYDELFDYAGKLKLNNQPDW